VGVADPVDDGVPAVDVDAGAGSFPDVGAAAGSSPDVGATRGDAGSVEAGCIGWPVSGWFG